MKQLIATMALALAAAEGGAATLLGDATLYAPNDLTVVQDGARFYEFLDLTSTYDLPVSVAIANHQADGFRWANATEMAALMSAFDYSYTIVPGDIGPLTYHGSQDWLVFAWNMVSRLGSSPSGEVSGSHYFGGFINDMPLAGYSTYLYLNPVGVAKVANDQRVFQANGIGTFLVRDAVAPVPEPGTAALWLLTAGLAAMRFGLKRGRANEAQA